jgi:hypothetical protein
MMTMMTQLPACFAAHLISGDRWEIITRDDEDDRYPTIMRLAIRLPRNGKQLNENGR